MSAAPAFTCPACGTALVKRENPTDLAASLGTWFDHPPIPGLPGGSMVGHTVSGIVPAAGR